MTKTSLKTILQNAIAAAKADPHGGKVMLTMKQAEALLADRK
jgi:hypothetical protein